MICLFTSESFITCNQNIVESLHLAMLWYISFIYWTNIHRIGSHIFMKYVCLCLSECSGVIEHECQKVHVQLPTQNTTKQPVFHDYDFVNCSILSANFFVQFFEVRFWVSDRWDSVNTDVNRRKSKAHFRLQQYISNETEKNSKIIEMVIYDVEHQQI